MSEHVELEGDIVSSTKGIYKVSPLCDDGAYMQTPDGKDKTIICTISGKLRKNKIQLLLGDRVKIKVSPFDLTRGFIVFRVKKLRVE